ncbi:MAG: Nudix family hydrolase [Gammaproteobacteria bacterium]|nr:Nudix family hydrolase [Gammaproteobacteria bacterium]
MSDIHRDSHVVAGIIRDTQDRILIAQRKPGTHLAGAWEFPGGKLEKNEDRMAGLRRELFEELSIKVRAASPLIQLHHNYPDRKLLLDFWCIEDFEGVATGAEGQALKWVQINALDTANILEADRPAINALRLPDRYAVTALPGDRTQFSAQIAAACANDVSLLQVRAPGADKMQLRALLQAAMRAAPQGRFLLNGDPDITLPIVQACGAAGIHLPSRFLAEKKYVFPDELLIAASCHNATELELAARIGASFAVLGPVMPTMSHPGVNGMGWEAFAELVATAMLPVYAIGGMTVDNIDKARASGAQGIAGISGFFAL